VSRLVDNGKTYKALRLIHDYVELIITEPLCTAQVFGSKSLDNLCQRIRKVNLKRIDQRTGSETYGQTDKLVFVYIVTRLQNSGGHRQVVEDFIKAQPVGRHIILSTELAGKSDADHLIKSLTGLADIVFERAPKAGLCRRLTWLQERLLEIRPKRVAPPSIMVPFFKLDQSPVLHAELPTTRGVSFREPVDYSQSHYVV
jgi:hypothetical protein